MRRKVISLFTLLAFVIFSISCTTIRTKEIKTPANWQGKKGKIFSVVKTSGEYIEFSKENPGRIYEGEIKGTAIILSEEVAIYQNSIKKIKKKEAISKIITKEGKTYYCVGRIKEEGNKVRFFSTYASSEPVSIPLSEVRSLRIKRINILLTTVVILGGLVFIFIEFLAPIEILSINILGYLGVLNFK